LSNINAYGRVIILLIILIASLNLLKSFFDKRNTSTEVAKRDKEINRLVESQSKVEKINRQLVSSQEALHKQNDHLIKTQESLRQKK
jgi:predicted Holliday junction resolvase-like endonuclease